MDLQATDKPRYLTLDQQHRIMSEFMVYVDHAPRDKVLFVREGHNIAIIPGIMNSFICWHAGFRGYGLNRYARGRLFTLFFPMIIGVTSRVYTEYIAFPSLVEPFRSENSLYYGWRYSACYQASHLTTTAASLLLTFYYAQRNGVLLIPQKKFIYGISVDPFIQIVTRVKPYRNRMLISWATTTAFMFGLGIATYRESCTILRERFNRRTFGQIEH